MNNHEQTTKNMQTKWKTIFRLKRRRLRRHQQQAFLQKSLGKQTNSQTYVKIIQNMCQKQQAPPSAARQGAARWHICCLIFHICLAVLFSQWFLKKKLFSQAPFVQAPFGVLYECQIFLGELFCVFQDFCRKLCFSRPVLSSTLFQITENMQHTP